MPLTVDQDGVVAYAAFPPEPDRDWLGRVAHLSAADLALVRRRAGAVTRLGYAVQLVTVRAIGAFQSDPTAVPGPVVAAIARQLGIDDPGVLAGYRDMPVRWRHTAEIRRSLRVSRLHHPTRPVRLHRLAVSAGLAR